MSKFNTIFQLIHSLSKAEKRYFKLYTALHGGQKDYLKLYNAICKANSPDSVKQLAFYKKKPGLLDSNCKYLYKIIIDCLLHLNTDADKTARLTNMYLKSRILFEKSLYEEGFALLKKIKTEAELYEEFVIQLWASQTELFYLSNLMLHTITEKELIQKQMKIDELLKYQKNIRMQGGLYESLQHRLLHKGSVRTQEQKDELNDLVVTELNYNANPLADTFESDKIHLLFQSYYFISISDSKSALRTLYELDNLMETHNHLWMERPADYLSMMEGILESLFSVKQIISVHPFLERLKKLKLKSPYYDVMLQRIIFIYSVAAHINAGEFEKALELKQQCESRLFNKITLLDLSRQAELYLFSAIIFMGLGDINKAHKELNKVLLESKLYYSLPVYRTFRLLHLLIQYELGNNDYIEYELRSLKRTYKGEIKKSYQVERIVFQFIKIHPLPSSIKARGLIWNKIETQFSKAEHDKYEQQLLRIFDFSSWIEAKLLRQTFAEVLLERKNTAAHPLK